MKDYIKIDYHPQPIWFATDEKKPKCKISDSLFVDLLKRNGFGIMDDDFVHRQESGVIKPTDEGEMTKWVYKYFKNMDYEDFLNPDFLGVVKSTIEVTHEDSDGERIVDFFSAKVDDMDVQVAILADSNVDPGLKSMYDYICVCVCVCVVSSVHVH